MKKRASSKGKSSHLRNARAKQTTSGSILNNISRDRSLSSNKDVFINSSCIRSSAGEDYVDEQHQKENLLNNGRQKSITSYSGIVQNSSSHSKHVHSSTKQWARRPSQLSWDLHKSEDANLVQEWQLGCEKVPALKEAAGAQSLPKIQNNKHSSQSFENSQNARDGSHDEPINEQKYLKKQSSLKKISQNQGNGGATHLVSYTKVFVMGDTRHGQLGFLNPNENSSSAAKLGEEASYRHLHVIERPKVCSYNILIKQIACGEFQTHLLSQDGYVYSMGSNEYGVLGLGQSEHVLKAVTQPQLVPGLQCVVQIAAGRRHSLALDVRREVYGWGRSDNGAIGLRMATPEHQSQPMPISLNLDSKDQVIQIDCGLEHSCFLSADGHVFGCGECEFGQLGVGYVSLKEYRPVRAKIKSLAAGDYVTKIACGAYHTLYLTRFKSLFAAGANNLGQIGIDSLDTQVNSPTLVEYLENKSIQEIACGESSFAISRDGDLYVWGLYNMQTYREPVQITEIATPVTAVSQSFFGVTAAIDQQEQAYYWHNQLEAQTQNLMQLPASPAIIKQMKRRLVKKVFTGKDLVFALGDDVNASTSNVKDSQTSSGLQEIPEKDEKPANSTKMPVLNLSKLNKASSSKSFKKQKSVSKEKDANRQSEPDQNRTQTKSRSQTASKQSRSFQKSTSGKKISAQHRLQRINSRSGSTLQRKSLQSQSKSKSPQVPKNNDLRRANQKVKAKTGNGKSDVRSASNSAAKRCVIASQSKSRKSASLQRTRSGSQQKHQVVKLANKAQNMTQQSFKSSKSMQGRVQVAKKKTRTLEQQVARKFQDLSQRLESDKSEVVTRLAQLSKKVSKIGRMSRKQQHSRQKSKVNAIIQRNEDHVNLRLERRSQNDLGSDVRTGSYEIMSDDQLPRNQQKSEVVLTNAIPHSRTSHQTFDGKKQSQYNMFNCASELAQDPELISSVSKPQLFYSPQHDTVDIRSPNSNVQVKTISTQQISNKPQKLQVDVSEHKETRFQVNGMGRPSDEYPKDDKFSTRLGPMSQEPRANTGPPTIVHQSHQQQQQQPDQTAMVVRRNEPAPAGYRAVRSPNSSCSKPLKSKSPPFLQGDRQTSTFDQQLILQLREQIDYLGRQCERLKEERLVEQMRAQDYMNRYEEVRKANLRIDVAQEGTLRSLESQLRTSKLEKSDLQIRLTDAERRVKDLEEKVIQLGAQKNKEKDYLNKLGQSHESLRMEKARTKDMQNQNDMLSKTITILETTVDTVKRDKELLERENERLKEYLQAKDLDVDIDGYKQMVGEQAKEALGRDTIDEMDRRSRSLGMRGSQNDSLKEKSRNESRVKHGSNASLLEKRIERSQERSNSKGRAASQLSQSLHPESNLIHLATNDHGLQKKVQASEPLLQPRGADAIDRYVDHDFGHKSSLKRDAAAGEAEQNYYTLRENLHHVQQPSNQHNYQTRESRETGRFQEQQDLARDVDRRETLVHDPRIQKLLDDAKILQQKHQTLLSTSPLRLKDRSAERENLSRCSSLARPTSSLKEASERAKQQVYHRISQHSVSPQIRPLPLNEQERLSTSPAYEQHDRSPLRRKSHQIEPYDRSSASGNFSSPLRRDDQARPHVQSVVVNQPVTQDAPLIARPAIQFEPPSQTSDGNPSTSNREPVAVGAMHQARATPIQEMSANFEDEEDALQREPVLGDYDADQIRARAGLKPSSLGPRRKPAGAPPSNGLKDLVQSAYQQKRGERHPHFPFEPEIRDFAEREPMSRSQGPSGRPRHDNRDYIAAVQKDLEENPTGSHLPRKPSPAVDRQKLEDQYNLKLLDQIQKLAERAKQQPFGSCEEPRVNKFKRCQGPLSSDKENSRSISSPAKANSSDQRPLPASIFSTGQDSRDAYQNKLNQLKRNAASSADNPGRRQPSVVSSGSKRPPSQRRTMSKEEDEDETRRMLIEPKKPGKQPWTNGLNNFKSIGSSVEKEKPTSQNNSFLARREALQNRLKKL